jgi:hypothetical protein
LTLTLLIEIYPEIYSPPPFLLVDPLFFTGALLVALPLEDELFRLTAGRSAWLGARLVLARGVVVRVGVGRVVVVRVVL